MVHAQAPAGLAVLYSSAPVDIDYHQLRHIVHTRNGAGVAKSPADQERLLPLQSVSSGIIGGEKTFLITDQSAEVGNVHNTTGIFCGMG